MSSSDKRHPHVETVKVSGGGWRWLFSLVVNTAIVLGAIGAMTRMFLDPMSGEIPWANLGYVAGAVWLLLFVFNGIMLLIDVFSRIKIDIRIDRDELKRSGADITPEQAEKIVRDVIESGHVVGSR